MPHSPTTRNPRGCLAIKDKGEGGRREARINPINPIIREEHSREGSNNGQPLDRIKGFFNVNLANHHGGLEESDSRLWATSWAIIILS